MSLGPLHIIKQTNKVATGSVIFLHGSGESGQRLLYWVKFLVKDFSLPHISFYFPTAPLRPYTPLQGELSNVWFDRYNITPDVPEHKETLKSVGVEIKNLIHQIVQSGVPLNKIIIGGFSMGGGLAFHVGYRFVPGLAGVFTLSSFLNNDSAIFNHLQSQDTPLYMCHGDRDTTVPISWGQKTFQDLTNVGIPGEFIIVKNAFHELKKTELLGLLEWIQKIIPNS